MNNLGLHLVGLLSLVGRYLVAAAVVLVLCIAWHFVRQFHPLLIKTYEDVSALRVELATKEDRLRLVEDQLAGMPPQEEPNVLEQIKGFFLDLAWEAPRQRVKQLKSEATQLSRDVTGIKTRLQGFSLESVVAAVQIHWLTALWVPVVVILLPYGWRIVAFWIFAPLALRWSSPLVLVGDPSLNGPPFGLIPAPSAQSLTVSPREDETLRLRSGHVLARQHVTTGSSLFPSGMGPLVSSAARLWNCTWVRREQTAPDGHVQFGPRNHVLQVMEVDLSNHPGLAVRARCLAGISDGVKVTTRWLLWRPTAWMTGQLRYVLVSGTGRIFLEGCGGILTKIQGSFESEHVLAFDSRLSHQGKRTEAFLPYLFGVCGLLDDRFTGEGLVFIQESLPASTANPVKRFGGAALNAIGKVLGL